MVGRWPSDHEIAQAITDGYGNFSDNGTVASLEAVLTRLIAP